MYEWWTIDSDSDEIICLSDYQSKIKKKNNREVSKHLYKKRNQILKKIIFISKLMKIFTTTFLFLTIISLFNSVLLIYIVFVS